MKQDEYLDFLAEKNELEDILSSIPQENVIDRLTYEVRLEDVETKINSYIPSVREPFQSVITFRGEPVFGTSGILAEFAGAAMSAFDNLVSALAVSFERALPASGAIAGSDQHRLIIRDIAKGSFGFEIVEQEDEQLAFDSSSTEKAMNSTLDVMRGLVGSDEELTTAIANIDERVLNNYRRFLKVLVKNEATCNIRTPKEEAGFKNYLEVERAWQRLAKDNIHDEEQELRGKFRGVFPDARQFEFRMIGGDSSIHGKIAEVINPERIQSIIGQMITVKVMVKWAGNARPYYTLHEILENIPVTE